MAAAAAGSPPCMAQPRIPSLLSARRSSSGSRCHTRTEEGAGEPGPAGRGDDGKSWRQAGATCRLVAAPPLQSNALPPPPVGNFSSTSSTLSPPQRPSPCLQEEGGGGVAISSRQLTTTVRPPLVRTALAPAARPPALRADGLPVAAVAGPVGLPPGTGASGGLLSPRRCRAHAVAATVEPPRAAASSAASRPASCNMVVGVQPSRGGSVGRRRGGGEKNERCRATAALVTKAALERGRCSSAFVSPFDPAPPPPCWPPACAACWLPGRLASLPQLRPAARWQPKAKLARRALLCLGLPALAQRRPRATTICYRVRGAGGAAAAAAAFDQAPAHAAAPSLFTAPCSPRSPRRRQRGGGAQAAHVKDRGRRAAGGGRHGPGCGACSPPAAHLPPRKRCRWLK